MNKWPAWRPVKNNLCISLDSSWRMWQSVAAARWRQKSTIAALWWIPCGWTLHQFNLNSKDWRWSVSRAAERCEIELLKSPQIRHFWPHKVVDGSLPACRPREWWPNRSSRGLRTCPGNPEIPVYLEHFLRKCYAPLDGGISRPTENK